MSKGFTGAVLAASLIALCPTPALAQSPSTLEGHATAGVANLIAPLVGAGFDFITPPGIGFGGTGFLVVVPGWALGGASARVSLNGRGPGPSRPFFAVELAAAGETDCCGGNMLYGIAAGFNRRRNDRSALRFETRLLIPARAEGGLLLVQVGLTFRQPSAHVR